MISAVSYKLISQGSHQPTWNHRSITMLIENVILLLGSSIPTKQKLSMKTWNVISEILESNWMRSKCGLRGRPVSFLIFHGDVSSRGLFPPIFRPSHERASAMYGDPPWTSCNIQSCQKSAAKCNQFYSFIVKESCQRVHTVSAVESSWSGKVRAPNRHKPITSGLGQHLVSHPVLHNNIKLHFIPISTLHMVQRISFE